MSVADPIADKKAKETARLLKSFDDFFALMAELGYEEIVSQDSYDETDYKATTRSNIEHRIKKGYYFTFKDPNSNVHVRFNASAPDRHDWYNDTHKLSVLVRPDNHQWSDKAFPQKPYAKPETLRKNIAKVIADAEQEDDATARQDHFFDLNVDKAMADLDTLFNGEVKLQGSKGCCDVSIKYKFHNISIELSEIVSKGIDKATIVEKVGRHDSRIYCLTLAQWKQHVDLLASFNAANVKGN